MLLHLIYDKYKIPVYGLCDWDVYGLSLLLTYKCGSIHMGVESFNYVVPIKWLGIHYNDIKILNLPLSSKQKLKKSDNSKIKSLLKHPYIKRNLEYYNELIKMKENGFKVELEALHCKGLNFISDKYIINKILNKIYFN